MQGLYRSGAWGNSFGYTNCPLPTRGCKLLEVRPKVRLLSWFDLDLSQRFYGTLVVSRLQLTRGGNVLEVWPKVRPLCWPRVSAHVGLSGALVAPHVQLGQKVTVGGQGMLVGPMYSSGRIPPQGAGSMLQQLRQSLTGGSRKHVSSLSCTAQAEAHCRGRKARCTMAAAALLMTFSATPCTALHFEALAGPSPAEAPAQLSTWQSASWLTCVAVGRWTGTRAVR